MAYLGRDTPAFRLDADDEMVDVTVPPSGDGCQECLASADGWWVNLRRCAARGHVGCCDSSVGRHATKHFEATGHRYMRTFEPGQDWFWDYETQATGDGPDLATPTSYPAIQPSVAPAERVPDNWRDLLN